ncbi:MAG: APC family permease [Acidobacteriaceae bacterium]|nr:APC family permease [Acidobacteriaceae bacterium]
MKNREVAEPVSTLKLLRELRLIDLVLFNIAATLGPQLIPAFAHVGPVAIPLHIAASVLFFVPCVVVVANLSRRYPGEGGFYLWTKYAYGEPHAFLCGWCWWLSVLLFLPSLMLIGAGMLTQATGAGASARMDDARWQVGIAVVILWFTVGSNILGLRFSKWLSNAGASMIYAGGALVLAAAIAVWVRYGSATNFGFDKTINLNRVSLWAQIAFAYTGLELGSLMGGEIRDPVRTIPRAAWMSAGAVTLGYVAGSWALMLVVAPENINPISGLVQVASLAGERLGLSYLGVLVAAVLFAGIVGKLSTWGGGAARLPLTVGMEGILPPMFTRLHARWKTPWVALVVQGAVCSGFLVLTQAGETVRSGWQLLMDMEILMAFLPYAYIFLTAGKFGQKWSGASGLLVTVIAMGMSLIPPENTASVLQFEVKVIGGSALLVLLGWFAFIAGTRRKALALPQVISRDGRSRIP